MAGNPAQFPGSGSAAALGGRAALALCVSVAGFVAVGLLGPSVVTVRLAGAVAGRPPYSLGPGPPGWLAVGLTAAALLVGAGGLFAALRALRAGWVPEPWRWLAGGLAAVVGFLLVPPAASGDALIYAAYGRTAALGGDPYIDTPRALLAVGDPVGIATEGPWQGVTSVYGPVATAVQDAASRLGGTSMQQTVWWLSVADAGAWIAAGLLLLALAGADRAARSRVLVLYWLNPLLLWAVPFGGHNDGQALVFAVAALLALRRRSVVLGAVLSGALIGVAGAVKLTEGVVGLGLLWAVRRRPAAAVALCAAAGAVLAVAYLPHWPEAVHQTSSNSGFISSASPWQWIRGLLGLVMPGSAAQRVVSIAAWASVAVVAAAVFRRLVLRSDSTGLTTDSAGAVDPDAAGRARVADAVQAVAAVGLGWLVVGSYTLPWYDMVAWAPLMLVTASALDVILLVRTVTVCLAYVATRQVPPELAPSAALAFVADRFRDTVSPAVHLGLVVALVRWARRGRHPGLFGQVGAAAGGTADPNRSRSVSGQSPPVSIDLR